MTIAVIVQARHGSSRLPGKVLEPIGERPALLWCLDRCRQIPGIDVVACAVPSGKADDEVADTAAEAGYFVTRGNEADVLSRYAKTAREVGAKTVMRVTSDCPLIDPKISGQVLDLYFSAGVDYVANNMPPKFPHGLDCEVFSAELLYAASDTANTAVEREHVTPWMRTHPALCKANLRGPGAGLENFRWTLDEAGDLAFFRALAEAFGPNTHLASASELASFCLRRPDLTRINQTHIDQNRLENTDKASLQTAPSRLLDVA